MRRNGAVPAIQSRNKQPRDIGEQESMRALELDIAVRGVVRASVVLGLDDKVELSLREHVPSPSHPAAPCHCGSGKAFGECHGGEVSAVEALPPAPASPDPAGPCPCGGRRPFGKCHGSLPRHAPERPRKEPLGKLVPRPTKAAPPPARAPAKKNRAR